VKNNNILFAVGLVLSLFLAGCATKEVAPPPAPEPMPAPAPEPKTYIIEGVHFAFDSAQLNSSASATLDEVAGALRSQPEVPYEVGGHTDSIGSNAYNQDLSERRAASVYNYLVAHGVAASQLSTRGYGETQPVASNYTEEGRAANRRVEIRPIQ
jgi:outer membrane protein OmpA-like peptidoglycan-associated protein